MLWHFLSWKQLNLAFIQESALQIVISDVTASLVNAVF